MKKYIAILCLLLMLTACAAPMETADVAATTGPVAQFASAIAEGTDIAITQIISDSVSCLHDYSLSVRQMQSLESSDLVLLSGAGLEDFMEDALRERTTADCSEGIALRELTHGDHSHGYDPHIWLNPDNAAIMAENICRALSVQYPEHQDILMTNAQELVQKLKELKSWGQQELSGLSGREIITFHDGFSYLAAAFDLTILASVEEESGSEASAADLTEIISLVREHDLHCVFTEANGSDAAATVICAETGAKSYVLDTAMGGSDYFEAMQANIQTLKEALQ
ncbi:MAG: zinc ABC transporter substrate-binding protein [Oscillospiraceae bacterium]|nr:zinc ABC transporter substrate-binding protein [Oscillospiraceae bacterium]